MTQRLAAAVSHGGGLLVGAPLWAWWALDRGGYPSPVWITGLVALALATAVALLWGPRPALRGPAGVAAAALGAYAALSALSMLVASDRGQAWLWSERALLYALAFALPLLWPPSLRAVKAGVVLWIAVVLAALALGLLRARHGVLVDGRLSDPTTYPNATAVLLLMGALPAVMLAALPRASIWQRGLGLAAAGALAAGAVLTQSRGILIIAAVVGVGAVLVCPARLRLAAAGACVLMALAWQRRALLDLHALTEGGAATAAVGQAVAAIGAIAAVLAIAGAGWAMAERRVRVPVSSPRQRDRIRRASYAAVLVGMVTVALAVSGGHPAAWAGAQLRDFKTPDYHRVESGDSRFQGGLGSNRYDYWRVAVVATARAPLRGMGAGSFVQTYFAERRTLRAPLYAHQLWLGAAAELGLPGLGALLVFVVAFAIALRRRLLGREIADAGLLLAATAPLAALLLHASGDWSFAFPGLAVPALGLAGAAIAAPGGPAATTAPGRPEATTAPGRPEATTAPGRPEATTAPGRPEATTAPGRPEATTAPGRPEATTAPGRPEATTAPGRPEATTAPGGPTAIAAPGGPARRTRHLRVAAAVIVLASAAAAVPLAVAEQLVQRAEALEASHPAQARADLHRAQRWAPLSGRPPLVLALLELRARDHAAARRAFADAHARDRRAWFPLLQLAILTPRDQRAQALALVRTAAAVNPGDPLIAETRRALSRGHDVSASKIARAALDTPG